MVISYAVLQPHDSIKGVYIQWKILARTERQTYVCGCVGVYEGVGVCVCGCVCGSVFGGGVNWREYMGMGVYVRVGVCWGLPFGCLLHSVGCWLLHTPHQLWQQTCQLNICSLSVPLHNTAPEQPYTHTHTHNDKTLNTSDYHCAKQHYNMHCTCYC